MEAVTWIGRMRALVGLVSAVIICILFWIAAIYMIFKQHRYGKAVFLIVLGAVIVALAALWYYLVMRSEMLARINGFVGMADAIDGGRS